GRAQRALDERDDRTRQGLRTADGRRAPDQREAAPPRGADRPRRRRRRRGGRDRRARRRGRSCQDRDRRAACRRRHGRGRRPARPGAGTRARRARGDMTVVGLMSGTSMDGLDAAVAELEWDGGAVAMSPLRHIERPWPDEGRARLAASLGPTTAGELCELDQLIGQASAQLAAELLPADLVVSHGQTVHHWVADGEAKGTLQLGQPAWIVEATGLPVISDVRARDIAAGGHGAPLAGILDDLWLRGEHTRAALNLGGIANVTIVRRGPPPPAFRTRPAHRLAPQAGRPPHRPPGR